VYLETPADRRKAVDGVLGAIDRKLRLAPLRLERKTPPRELLDRERALDRRLDVERHSWRAASADSQR